MTDKVQKIRDEVERLYNQSLADENRQAELGLESAACTSYGKSKVCKELLSFIDSMQEEPVSIDFEQELYKAFGQVKDFTLGMRIAKWFYDMGRKHQEPVSEDLEDFALQYAGHHAPYDDCMQEVEDAFKAGAKWQKEQFENNRLKHCNSITNEQAELEQGFIDQHLDKHQRIPTYLDAIEYGMNLQKEQMIKNAVNGIIDYPVIGHDFPNLYPNYRDLKDYCDKYGIRKDGKVKVIIINEDDI